LRRGLERNLHGLHELPGLGYELALEPDDDADHWLIIETDPAGHTRELHIDRATGLIAAAIETKALHPDVDPTETRQETRFGGWQEHGDVLIVTDSVTRDMATGEVISRVQVTAVEVNPAVDAGHFRAPVPFEAG
jgi:hypothetical protein